MLAFYSNDPSSNPAEVFSFCSLNCLKRTQIHDKLACDGQTPRNVQFLLHKNIANLTKIGISNDLIEEACPQQGWDGLVQPGVAKDNGSVLATELQA